MFLSKMTASILDDLNYIVDPSAVSFETVQEVEPWYLSYDHT